MNNHIQKLIILFFFLVIGNISHIQARDIPDTCTILFFPHIHEQGYFNPDSVLYDTCDNSPTLVKD